LGSRTDSPRGGGGGGERPDNRQITNNVTHDRSIPQATRNAILEELSGTEIAPCAFVEEEHPFYYAMEGLVREWTTCVVQNTEGTKSNLPTFFCSLETEMKAKTGVKRKRKRMICGVYSYKFVFY